MLARLQQLTTLGAIALAVTWACACLHAGRISAAPVGAMILLCGHAAVLAFGFVLLRRAHKADSTPRATSRQLFRAWWGEVHAAHAVFCWRQPFRSHRWPDVLPAQAHGRRGVVLIHGFVCNRGVWNRWLERLTRQGVAVVAVDLEPVFGSIDDYSPAFGAAVRRIERCTGLPPVVVAHSMGGLALRRWWAESGNGERLHHALTIGTPHHGTWLARFGTTTAAREMRVGSRWLRALAESEPPSRARRITCFYGHCDNIVFPPESAVLAGADNRHLEAVAHLRMVDHPEPWNALTDLLQATRAPCRPCGCAR